MSSFLKFFKFLNQATARNPSLLTVFSNHTFLSIAKINLSYQAAECRRKRWLKYCLISGSTHWSFAFSLKKQTNKQTKNKKTNSNQIDKVLYSKSWDYLLNHQWALCWDLANKSLSKSFLTIITSWSHMKDLINCIFLSLNVCTVLKLIFLFVFLGAPNAKFLKKFLTSHRALPYMVKSVYCNITSNGKVYIL